MSHAKRLTPIIFSVFMLTAVATGFSACGKNDALDPAAHQSAEVPVETHEIINEEVPSFEDYQGTLISRQSVTMQPRVAGQVSRIFVKAGDKVRAGQPLLLIDSRQQQAAVTSTLANASALKAQIKQAQDSVQSLVEQRGALSSTVELNQKLVLRYTNLYKKGAASKQDIDQYTNALDKAKSELEANEAQIKAQQSAVITASKNHEGAIASTGEASTLLQFYRINAPFAGTVGDIPVKVGTYVSTETQLLSVTEAGQLELNVGIPANKAFEIQPGLKVDVLDNLRKRVSRSAISFISPLVDSESQTILVKAIVQNTDGRLKANQSVKSRVYFSRSAGVKIPTGAVSHMGGQDFVFVATKQGGKMIAKQQPVQLGALMDGSHYVVTNGLKPGDKLITSGIQMLMDGMPISETAANDPTKQTVSGKLEEKSSAQEHKK